MVFILADTVVPGTVTWEMFGEMIWKGIFCVAWASYPPADLVSSKYNLGLLAALDELCLFNAANGKPVCAVVNSPVSILRV